MWFLRDEPHTGRISDLLPWGAVVHGPAPVVLQNKGYTFQATLAYQGADWAMLEPEEQLVYVHRLHQLLMRLGTGWGILPDLWHEPTLDYPASAWRNPTACFVDAARRALFTSGALHESHSFLTLTWQPPSETKARWYDRFFEAQPQAVSDHRDIETFVHAVTRWADGLSGLLPSWQWLDPSATLTYLHRCVSWSRAKVGFPDVPIHIAARLGSTPFVPGHTPQLGTRFLRPLEIQSWPAGTPEEGGGLGMRLPVALQQLPFPFRFTVRYVALDKADGEQALMSTMRKWARLVKDCWPGYLQWAFPGDATEQASSVARALQALRANAMHFGYCTPTLLVWGDTEEELAYREREATKVLQDEGLIVAQDTVNACQAWLGSLDMVHNVRAPLIPSLGLAGLLPHATIWAGEERDAHLEGPPLFLASSDGVPFRFVLHPRQSELGHTMILGPSRTGKSAILGLMMSQFWRYHDAQIFCFDKDEQLYTTTLLHGGVHYDCHGVSVQPLGRIDAVGEQRWALGWLMQVIRSRGVALTPEDEEQLWVALERLAGFPRPLRTLSGYAACLQVQRLKRALQPFLMGGPYAFFDADHDAIQWQDWTTIEMRALQGMPDALPHALRYFFHGIEQRLTGRPTLIVLDEVRKLAADPVFGLELLDWIKERAKVNVSVVMSSQDFADLSKTVIWEALQNNTQTWVFLPNPEAVNAVMAPLYASIGLSAAQREFLALSTPKQDYLYKSGRSARRFQMVLTPLERALVAASTPEEIAAMRALRQEPLKEPLVSAWLRTQGFGNEADIYRTHYDKEYADAAHL